MVVMKKDIARLIELARRQGWNVERTNGGHWRFIPTEKGASIVIASSTPSDSREIQNTMSRLRRSGLKA